jgi:cytochrome c-type biogenesis protein
VYAGWFWVEGSSSMTDIGYIAAFLAGLLSFLSPCVLPLVPPYLCYIAGTSIEELSEVDARSARWRIVGVSLLFVAGFTTVFVLLGATASVLVRPSSSWACTSSACSD